ncbi:hypothetical protein ACH34F_12110 [Elizabethkingia anophelis]|uniref:hypothetical protein n=1 Tax=Elizabethkingia anophelis TaxID=1117645 RepID=UPI0037870011
MKQSSTQILEIINDESLNQSITDLISSYPEHNYNDRIINESYQQFLEIKDLLRVNIESNFFEKISFSKRNQILSYLQNIKSQSSNVNQTILNIDTLYDYLISTGLQINLISERDFTKEFKNLTSLQNELEILVNEFRERQTKLEDFDNNFNHVSTNKEQVDSITQEIEKEKDKIINYEKEAKDLSSQLETIKTNIISIEQEIDAKKLNVNTFSENIEDYKSSIEGLEKKGKAIIEKDKVISSLIEQAEKALNLKSAEGISAAFSSQYGKERNLGWWIFGAAVFIILAIALTIWIIGGWHIANPNSLSSIIGRIVAVGISITGATFCAKQYTKQSNITEDYAYKAVLSKSIIAFTEEIKKRDDKKVAEYLEKVLNEIHQDPLRKREIKEDDNDSVNFLKSTIEKALDKIPSTK